MQMKLLLLLQAAAVPLVLAQEDTPDEVVETSVSSAAEAAETTSNIDAPIEEDGPGCATVDIASIMDVPRPTGALLEALSSFASKTIDPAAIATTMNPASAEFTDDAWCAFTTAAPSQVQPALTSYLSELSVWGNSFSTALTSAAEACPSAASVVFEDPAAWYDFIDVGVFNVYRCINEATATESGDGPRKTGADADSPKDGDDKSDDDKEDEDKPNTAGMTAAFGMWTVITGAVSVYMLG